MHSTNKKVLQSRSKGFNNDRRKKFSTSNQKFFLPRTNVLWQRRSSKWMSQNLLHYVYIAINRKLSVVVVVVVVVVVAVSKE